MMIIIFKEVGMLMSRCVGLGLGVTEFGIVGIDLHVCHVCMYLE